MRAGKGAVLVTLVPLRRYRRMCILTLRNRDTLVFGRRVRVPGAVVSGDSCLWDSDSGLRKDGFRAVAELLPGSSSLPYKVIAPSLKSDDAAFASGHKRCCSSDFGQPETIRRRADRVHDAMSCPGNSSRTSAMFFAVTLFLHGAYIHAPSFPQAGAARLPNQSQAGPFTRSNEKAVLPPSYPARFERIVSGTTLARHPRPESGCRLVQHIPRRGWGNSQRKLDAVHNRGLHDGNLGWSLSLRRSDQFGPRFGPGPLLRSAGCRDLFSLQRHQHGPQRRSPRRGPQRNFPRF